MLSSNICRSPGSELPGSICRLDRASPLTPVSLAGPAFSMSEPFRINYARIAEPLKEIPIAICNRLRPGEKRAELRSIHVALPTIIEAMVKVAAGTYQGAKQLASDNPTNQDRRLRNVVCIPPLARAVLENLFTFIFLHDQPAANVPWYLASTWLDARSEHDKLVARHGSDPEYTEWLAKYLEMVEDLASDAGLSLQQRKDPNLVRAWPLPAAMSHGQKRGSVDATEDPDRRAFLRHLRKWFYGSLSADAHFSGLGFIRRGGVLLHELDSSMQDVRLSQNFFQLLTVYVAFLSEVVGQLGFPHEANRLNRVWAHISRWPEAKDLFDVRYGAWLRRAAG